MKNIGCPVKFAFQINKIIFSISVSYTLHRTYPKRGFIFDMKCRYNWVSCIRSATLPQSLASHGGPWLLALVPFCPWPSRPSELQNQLGGLLQYTQFWAQPQNF